MSLNETTSVHARTLAAFFDTKGAADKAIADLEAIGIPKHHITMVAGGSTSGAGATTLAPQHEGFLQSLKDLFMPEEDQYSYAEGLRRGGYLVSIRTEEANYNRVLDILDRDGAVDMDERESTWRSEGWTGYQAGAIPMAASGLAATDTAYRAAPATASSQPLVAKGTTTEGSDEIIPVYEESLQVGKREVSHGRLRVRSYVVETAVNEQVSLRTENVHVDRRPVDRAVSATDAMFQDRVIEVEEFAEEAVVSKQARAVEEVSLHKEARDRTETITDTLRHTEVEVEDGRGTVVGGTTTRSGIVEGSNAGSVMAHMDVIASDGTKVGTVDHQTCEDDLARWRASLHPDDLGRPYRPARSSQADSSRSQGCLVRTDIRRDRGPAAAKLSSARA